MDHALRATALTLAILALIIGGPIGLSFIAGEIWSELNFFVNQSVYLWNTSSTFEQLGLRWLEGVTFFFVFVVVTAIAYSAFQVTAEKGEEACYNTTQ